MEQKLENSEIAKVFSLYMSEDARVKTEKETLHLVGVDIFHNTIDVCESYDSVDTSYEVVQDVKLLLTPLSSITDEHAIEVAKLYHCSLGYYLPDSGKQVINRGWYLNHSYCFQYLIQQGYAVPLFFGVNHLANGKTAIELGIAIDKTTI